MEGLLPLKTKNPHSEGFISKTVHDGLELSFIALVNDVLAHF